MDEYDNIATLFIDKDEVYIPDGPHMYFIRNYVTHEIITETTKIRFTLKDI